MQIKITGSGSYIPTIKVTNSDFGQHHFLNEDGSIFNMTNEVIAEKFVEITGILERRYADPDMVNSDMAFIAAKKAIENSGVDPETLDYIINGQINDILFSIVDKNNELKYKYKRNFKKYKGMKYEDFN